MSFIEDDENELNNLNEDFKNMKIDLYFYKSCSFVTVLKNIDILDSFKKAKIFTSFGLTDHSDFEVKLKLFTFHLPSQNELNKAHSNILL
jgi:hypothetical protein